MCCWGSLEASPDKQQLCLCLCFRKKCRAATLSPSLSRLSVSLPISSSVFVSTLQSPRRRDIVAARIFTSVIVEGSSLGFCPSEDLQRGHVLWCVRVCVWEAERWGGFRIQPWIPVGKWRFRYVLPLSCLFCAAHPACMLQTKGNEGRPCMSGYGRGIQWHVLISTFAFETKVRLPLSFSLDHKCIHVSTFLCSFWLSLCLCAFSPVSARCPFTHIQGYLNICARLVHFTKHLPPLQC